MTEIYLKENLSDQENSPKRTLTTIDRIVASLLPERIKFNHSKTLPSGFIYRFSTENEANMLFTRDNVANLATNSLSIDLTKKSQPTRVIFVPDISQETFDRNDQDIIENVMSRNLINVIKLDKFESDSHRRYLKIYVDNQDACFKILSNGKIKVFNENLNAEPVGHVIPAIFANRRLAHQADRGQHRFLNDSNPWNGPNRNPQFNPYLHGNGNTYPGHFNSPAERKYHSYPQNPNWPPIPNKWHRQADSRNFENSPFEKVLISAIHICKILSCGLSEPQLFVDMCVATHKSYGLPPLIIPHDVIDASLNKFKENNPPPQPQPPAIPLTPPTLLDLSQPPPILNRPSRLSPTDSPPHQPQPPPDPSLTSPLASPDHPPSKPLPQTPSSGPSRSSSPQLSSSATHSSISSDSISSQPQKSLHPSSPTSSSPHKQQIDSTVTKDSISSLVLLSEKPSASPISTSNAFNILGGPEGS